MFFNSAFSEFDLLLYDITTRIFNLSFINYNISPWIKLNYANNLSYNSGYISTITDRSYKQYQLGTSILINDGEFMAHSQ